MRAAAKWPVVLPLHPRTRQALVRDDLLDEAAKYIKVINPVGYLDMVMLEKNARLIATDSGGVQKEAFFYRVPCVTLRDETEWVELVHMGWNQVVPPTSADVVYGAISGWGADAGRNAPTDAAPYGEGQAAEKIVSCLTGGHHD